MKQINNYILCFIVILFTSSCNEELLDLKNENTLSTGLFWQTEADIDAGVVAVYNMFYRQGTWTRNMYTQIRGMSDEAVSYAGWTELNEYTKFIFTNYNFYETNVKMWEEHYVAINRANQVLDNIDNVTFSDEAHKNDLIGQTKFLRAFYYFYMTALWDNVPLVLQTSSAADQPMGSTADEVLTQIEEDLEDAVSKLPATRSDDETGRPTKGAAYALLAKAYAQHHKWEEAKTTLEWLVDGPGSGYYDLVTNWADNFNNNTENNIESIFEIQFSLMNRVGFDQTDNHLDPNAQLGTQIEMNQAPSGIGWNNIEARRWLVDYYKREKTTDGKNDIRLFYSFWYDGAASDFPDYPNQLIYGAPWNNSWGNRVFIKKYSTDELPLYYWNDNNFRSLRYADILLLYAEVLNEVNGTPTAKAIELVNRVRNRVKLPNIQNSTYYNGNQVTTNQDAFREHIKVERSLELATECVRWIDLKRWGINDAETLDELKERDSDFNNFIIGKSIRMPIPQSEVDNNPNLDQNEQY
ncbi:RagB/SusD family nutrient uptake outer membrane protein [Mariniflexile maritimum]|uniref:RagB/SusD family nutrient uptake outer membrane protein n=1 Tax=Mariniflexile maritimum TaxID=2682493 RepID=UPI0012F62A1B|nr:RagB/SusD family nutrient uptake outer membrane protein [Mariniflexile maritimum]